MYTPRKINIEPENDGLESGRSFSFSRGVISGSMLIFRGVQGKGCTSSFSTDSSP